MFLMNNLLDKFSIVVAQTFFGGKDTPSLIDGKCLSSVKELSLVTVLKLTEVKKLTDSYLHLKYDIINETKLV